MPVVDVTEFMAEDGEEFVVGLGDFDHLVGEDDGTARKGEGVGARIEFSEFDVVGREARAGSRCGRGSPRRFPFAGRAEARRGRDRWYRGP